MGTHFISQELYIYLNDDLYHYKGVKWQLNKLFSSWKQLMGSHRENSTRFVGQILYEH